MLKIIANLESYMKSMKLKYERDYNLFVARQNGKEDTKVNINIALPLKGNKKIIEYFKNKGWYIRDRYKNNDGNIDLWSSKEFEENNEHRRVIIVLAMDIDNDYIEALKLFHDIMH